jgi:hypothetical protein
MKKHAAFLFQLAAALVAVTVPVLAGLQPTPTPEPATVLLMGGGLAAVILIARRKRAQK